MTSDFAWRWLDGLATRSARRHTMAAFDAQLHERSAGTAGSVVLLLSSWVLYGLIAALLAVGVWLGSLSFPGPGLLLGLLVLGIVVELRPRFGRLPKFATEVTAAEAPQLHALVAQVAAAVGAPAPAIYIEDDQFNAAAGRAAGRPVAVRLPPAEWTAGPAGGGPGERVGRRGAQRAHERPHRRRTGQAQRPVGADPEIALGSAPPGASVVVVQPPNGSNESTFTLIAAPLGAV